jgi:hypothetical protein
MWLFQTLLTCIYQRSLDSGELPNDWRSANISCLYKKGDKHKTENYRPVSLTSVPCKFLEHIICKNIMKHLEKNKVLTTLNNGFNLDTHAKPNSYYHSRHARVF